MFSNDWFDTLSVIQIKRYIYLFAQAESWFLYNMKQQLAQAHIEISLTDIFICFNHWNVEQHRGEVFDMLVALVDKQKWSWRTYAIFVTVSIKEVEIKIKFSEIVFKIFYFIPSRFHLVS